jgi:hypothetical protein
MTIESWKEEFYPTSVTVPMTRLEAVAHSTRKWSGTAPEALKKHGVEFSRFKIFDPCMLAKPPFDFNSDSCSLCEKYWDKEEDEEDGGDPCRECPFSLTLGRACIENHHNENGDFMESDFFSALKDASQMRAALNKLLELETALAANAENARLDAISDAKFFADQASAAESPEELQAIHKSIYG